jgi:hypothetical protein
MYTHTDTRTKPDPKTNRAIAFATNTSKKKRVQRDMRFSAHFFFARPRPKFRQFVLLNFLAFSFLVLGWNTLKHKIECEFAWTLTK